MSRATHVLEERTGTAVSLKGKTADLGHRPFVLLFASGASALVFQILWVKQLSTVVGIDAYAITTGVSAFFAGLAVGSILFGRMTDRVKRPLLLYALIEAATALSATSAKVVLANSASSQSQRGS